MFGIHYSPEALARTCRRLGLRMVVLFGSRATGKPRPAPDSDLDIAVWDAMPYSSGRFFALHHALSDLFGDLDLDLSVLNDADPLFRQEIMQHGKLLYGDPRAFLEYKAYAFKDYLDSRDLLRLEDALFKKKMKIIGKELHGSA